MVLAVACSSVQVFQNKIYFSPRTEGLYNPWFIIIYTTHFFRRFLSLKISYIIKEAGGLILLELLPGF